MGKSQFKVLISEKDINNRIKAMGEEITEKFQGQEIVAVGVLKGSFIFLADLIRHIDLPVRVEFLGVSSYGDKKTSSGEVKVTMDMSHPLEGSNVLLIEDVVDSGLTMNYLQKTLRSRNPKSLSTATFLFKPQALKTNVTLDFVGFNIGNEFVVGYGLDYAGKHRNLPYLAELLD